MTIPKAAAFSRSSLIVAAAEGVANTPSPAARCHLTAAVEEPPPMVGPHKNTSLPINLARLTLFPTSTVWLGRTILVEPSRGTSGS